MADILGYARVSTHTQGLEAQKRRLQEEGAVRVFEDVVSGRTFERPGLTALMEYARPGDRVCVVRLDRLGRSLRELLDTVETLKQEKIDLISLEEQLDTSSAAGELVFHVFGALAHFERRLIAERTREGVESARMKGKRLGRPPLENKKLDAAFKLMEAGISPTEAAKQLGLGRSSLYREIKKKEAVVSS
jgi:DNA invertase Pin-like site-specific DNA recombinase